MVKPLVLAKRYKRAFSEVALGFGKFSAFLADREASGLVAVRAESAGQRVALAQRVAGKWPSV